MISKTRKIRMLSLILIMTMLLSTISVAWALPTDVIDAKDELATVDIVQTYNGSVVDKVTHNYYIQSETVTIDYEAVLKMTYEMAWYLQQRQTQLKNAKFNVHINMEMDKLEFVDAESDTVSVIFKSTFLKPWENRAGYTVEFPTAFVDESDYAASKYAVNFLGRDDEGFFSYEIIVDKEWALSKNSFDVPMELITYYDENSGVAFSYEVASTMGTIKYEPLMYGDFAIKDWMEPITLSVANMKVKDSVRESVTEDPKTWTHIVASGTVDGEFTYVPGECSQIESLEKYGSETTLEFGNGKEDAVFEEWTSDEVWVYLIRFDVGSGVIPDSPFLNMEDHFAYIIGMPDGLVHPEWTITRAEVATIFFRMLTDDVRNEFWTQTNPYGDVQITDWYNNAISTLTNLGVVNGMPDGDFHPNDNITRGEFATMAVRFFLITEDMYGEVKEDAFSDIAKHWANEYINMAYLLDIVDGYPDGTYRPDNDIDRAEAMTIVNNTLRRSPCNEGIEPVEEHEDFITWPDNMDKSKWYYAAVQEATNSHVYTYFTENEDMLTKELWTDILEVRDWAAFERAWSDANSAVNPGEVVDGN